MSSEYYEALTAIKDATLAVAGGCTAYAALSGLHTWKRQLQGGVKFEVARGLAKATYKVRDALWAVRSPATWSSEYPEDYRAKSSHTAEEKGDGLRHVYNKRLEGLTAALQDFDIQTLEGEALWGAEVREATDKLRACTWELNAAIQAYIDDVASGHTSLSGEPEFRQEIKKKIWAHTGQKNNPLTEKINKAINSIDALILPHLRDDAFTFASWWNGDQGKKAKPTP